MPEVAEVALTADSFNAKYSGAILLSVKIYSGRYTRKLPEGYKEFIESLPMKINSINSVGKFFYIDFKNYAIWNTFGLSGRWCTQREGMLLVTLKLDIS